MERIGQRLLLRHNPNRGSSIARWSAHELAQIERTGKRTVRIAALTGALSGGTLAGAEILLRGWLTDHEEADDWQEQLPFWAAYMGIVLLVSGVEIAYLYWLVLRAVGHFGAVAGLAFTRDELDRVIHRGLSRSALDFPNPQEPIYDIDPYARVSGTKLTLYAVAYRLKVGATSFLVRVLLRRFLARAAVRFVVPVVAVPVFAVWNALIVHWVMQAARIRVAGPIAVKELTARLREQRDALDKTTPHIILSAVEEAIIRSCDAHPNYVLLLTALFRELGTGCRWDKRDWAQVRCCLRDMAPEQQRIVLDVVTTAVFIDGRLRREERGLLQEVYASCGRDLDDAEVLAMHRRFLSGRGVCGDRGDEDG